MYPKIPLYRQACQSDSSCVRRISAANHMVALQGCLCTKESDNCFQIGGLKRGDGIGKQKKDAVLINERCERKMVVEEVGAVVWS